MINVFDTTLRDGEQMPGIRFTLEQKIDLAQKIDEFGAKIIENMPVVSKEESQTTKQLVELGLKAEIRALARLRKTDVDCAADCGINRILLVSPVSDIHLQHKLQWTRQENIERALELIDHAHSYGMKVDYAGEDASRANNQYLIEFLKTIENKINYFLVGDTVGCLTPEKSHDLFKQLEQTAKCKLEAHHHNDFGLATASTLAAIKGGADAFTGTFCGIGERAGNAPIEEVCLGVKLLENKDLDVDFSLIHTIGKKVIEYSGIPLSPHKPWIGNNAFTHESGIHVSSVAKNPLTYEPIKPEFIGHKRRIVTGKHSGGVA